VSEAALRTLGLTPRGSRVAGWVVDPDVLRDLPGQVEARFAEWAAAFPVAEGMPVATLRQSVPVPDTVLTTALADTDLIVHNGMIRRAGAAGVPAEIDQPVRELVRRLAEAPFIAPEATELADLGLGQRELAAAARAGLLVHLTGTIVLAADAPARAAEVLAGLPSPFTVSEARQALGTTRRVAVPLLEHLDAKGVTVRAADGTRRVRHR
jgi:selenocysteine-specific elongation factor